MRKLAPETLERMVRQLLQLTHYETIPSAGGAPMIDLNRSAGTSIGPG
jgi:hypothetical protein